jgi:hypothetical protein
MNNAFISYEKRLREMDEENREIMANLKRFRRNKKRRQKRKNKCT